MKVQNPTCTKKGQKDYTASVLFNGETFKDTISEEIEATGHDWNKGWKSDYLSNSIYRECILCGDRETAKNPFTDVSDNAYYVPIVWAYHTKLTTGVNENTFAGNRSCTRGQVVTFLWRIVGQPEPKMTKNPFKDVSESSPFYKAILWASENGITTGTAKDKFSPSATCTRGQVVTFLWRMAGKPEPKTTKNPFKDVSESSPFYKAILWASENEITSGTGSGFKPSATCTRAQVVTFLYRYDIDYLINLSNSSANFK
ncbi:cell wall/surface repeat protein [Lachnospiraceae bacterium TWA4]|nr:cell wall/surface repeat protein [Lachnospiraceae bacterium TWA4]